MNNKDDVDGDESTAPQPTNVYEKDDETNNNNSNNGGENPAVMSDPKPKLLLYSRPKQRQRWDDEHHVLPHVNWGDLFLDLFYVGAAYNLAGILVDMPSGRGILYFVGSFVTLFKTWMSKTYYDASIAVENDSYHMVLDIAQFCLLGTAVLHIRPVGIMSDLESHVEMFAFCISAALDTVIIVMRDVEVALCADGEPAVRVHGRRHALCMIPAFSCLLAATIVSGVAYYHGGSDNDDSGGSSLTADVDDYNRQQQGGRTLAEENEQNTDDVPIYLCLVAPVTTVASVFFANALYRPEQGEWGARREKMVPLNVPFVIHRFGEWVMLMLGESILSLLIVDVTEQDREYYLTFYAGILSIILLQYMHFRSQPHHAEEHGMRRGLRAGLAFTLSTVIYSAALIALGASYKRLVYEHTYDDQYYRRRLLITDVPVKFGQDTPNQRILAAAGGGGGGSSDGGAEGESPQDRQEHTANLFCVSMAVAWAALDLSILSHRGLRKNVKRFTSEANKKLFWKGVWMITFRTGLIVFIATLSTYVTDPDDIALLGLAGIVAQVILRVLGDFYFFDGVKARTLQVSRVDGVVQLTARSFVEVSRVKGPLTDVINDVPEACADDAAETKT